MSQFQKSVDKVIEKTLKEVREEYDKNIKEIMRKNKTQTYIDKVIKKSE